MSSASLLQLTFLILFSFLTLSGWVATARADQLPPAARVLRDLDSARPIGWYIDALRDASGNLSLEDVRQDARDSQFEPVLRDTPVFWETDDAIWLRFRVDTRGGKAKDTLLTLPRPMTDRIDVYFNRGNGYELMSDGRLVERPGASSFKGFVFEMPEDIKPENPIYIRVQDRGLVTLPFIVQDQQRFISSENSSSVMLGVAVGGLFLLCIGILAVFSRSRSITSSLSLLFFTLSIMIFIAIYSGFLPSLLPMQLANLSANLGVMAMLIAPVAMAFFVTTFYERPLTDLAVKLGIGSILAISLVTLFSLIIGVNVLASGAILAAAIATVYAFYLAAHGRFLASDDVSKKGGTLIILGTAMLVPGIVLYVALEAVFDTPPWMSELGYMLMAAGNIGLFFGNDRKVNAANRAEKARLISAAGRLQAVFETANDALFVLDGKGQVVETNSVAETLFDLQESSVVGRQIIDLIIPPSLRMGHRQALKRYIQSGDGYFKNGRTDTRGQKPDGESFPISITMSTVIIDKSPFFTMRVSESTEYVQNETAPAIQSRYDLAFRATGDVIADWDAQTESIYLSNNFENIFGMDTDFSLKAANFIAWDKVIHPDDQVSVQNMSRDIRKGKITRGDITYRIYHGVDTSLRWIKTSAAAELDAAGKVSRVATVSRDITHRQVRENELAQEAFHDALTGLSNRARIIDRLKHLISRHNQGLESKGIILIINIDRFQQINDNLGHSAGDEFLVIVARRIENFAGREKTLARLEGDTFALLIEGEDDAGDAQTYAREMQNAITQPVFLQGQEIFPSVSIGVAQLGYRHNRAEEALSDAHRALSQGREQSAGRIKVFGLNTKASSDGRLALEAALHHALNREELMLHYQPIVDLETSQLAGFEALMRWNHPEQGMISPGKFIPISEETGLIIEMGAWALKEACTQVATWQKEHPDHPPFFISVNVSARQFVDHDLVGDVEVALKESGINPGLVKLEITEGLIMENPEFAAVVLEKFKSLGVMLSIDDFGTGYSSLSYLHRFPFDVLKIDRSFVMTMLEKQQSEVIIRSIASLAHNLEMEIVAEGAEKLEQIDKLYELGCEYVQGFYFGRPLGAEQAALWFTDPEGAMENEPRKSS